jgi:hypothetical protein
VAKRVSFPESRAHSTFILSGRTKAETVALAKFSKVARKPVPGKRTAALKELSVQMKYTGFLLPFLLALFCGAAFAQDQTRDRRSASADGSSVDESKAGRKRVVGSIREANHAENVSTAGKQQNPGSANVVRTPSPGSNVADSQSSSELGWGNAAVPGSARA